MVCVIADCELARPHSRPSNVASLIASSSLAYLLDVGHLLCQVHLYPIVYTKFILSLKPSSFLAYLINQVHHQPGLSLVYLL